MFCDYDVIVGQPYQVSIKCHSNEGQILAIKKEVFTQLQLVSDDHYKQLVKEALA